VSVSDRSVGNIYGGGVSWAVAVGLHVARPDAIMLAITPLLLPQPAILWPRCEISDSDLKTGKPSRIFC
jgi:hypothetical protein